MPVQRDFRAYHQSIATELLATKDRIRNLIGQEHWLTDGEHKEAILRKTLRNHVPESLHIGTGFVCGRSDSSSQIDVLLTKREKPTLFRDGELMLVTPDSVACIIEVKTQLLGNLPMVLEKLSDNVEMIRSEGSRDCKAGLFVYEGDKDADDHERILRALHSAARRKNRRIINWVAAGPSQFIRYWHKGDDVNSPISGRVWHSYCLILQRYFAW